MDLLFKKENIIKLLTLFYFTIAGVEIAAEYFLNLLLINSLKPLLPLIIILIYSIESVKSNKIFLLILLISSLNLYLLNLDTAATLYYMVILSAFIRILLIYIILKVQKIKDFIPVIIGIAPFLLFFFYLLSETSELPQNSIYILIFHVFLISFIAGIGLASYMMNDNKQNSILLISVLLLVMVQFVVYVEKYFLKHENEALFRTLGSLFYILAYFSFYKYLITFEKDKTAETN